MIGRSNSHLPQRHLLCDQVAQFLREGIEDGRWGKELPTEAALCRELEVSRVTLRRALGHLVNEKQITLGGRGHHHQILRSSEVATQVRGSIVRVLCPVPVFKLGGVHHVALEHLAARIAKIGCRLAIEHHPRLYERHQPLELERLDSQSGTAGWVLLFSTPSIQEWFGRRGRPCVVLGPLHEAAPLSCVLPDASAAAHHAVGIFYSRGHRDLAYLTDMVSPGDQLASSTFDKEARRLGLRVQIVSHRLDIPSIRKTLNGLLVSKPRPTAYFSNCPEHCITALCHFLNAGLRVPEDVALIAGWDDLNLEYAVPSFARYRVDGMRMGVAIGKALVEGIRHGSGKISSIRIVPDFVEGETVGATGGQSRVDAGGLAGMRAGRNVQC
jgi:DNA-binding LacI/PurR family transcriptional regulator